MDKRLPLVVTKAQIACRKNDELKARLKTHMAELAILSSDERIKKTLDNIDSAISSDPELKNSSCIKGCAHCCFHKIEVTPSELNLINTNKTTVKHDALACPLLDENNNCTVYDVRPIICRLTHVSSLPDNCKKEGTDEIKHLSVTRASLAALAYFMLEPELITLRDHLD